MTRLIVSSLLAFSVFAATGASAAVYDATTDFQTLSNPGSVWSYGYSHPVGPAYSMTLFDNHSSAGWSMLGYVSLGTPAIWKNPAAYAQYGVAPGQVSLHPGPSPDGDFAILRFTAPVVGMYNVTGQFYAGDGGSMNGSIVLDGNLSNPLQYFTATTDQSFFTPLSLHLNGGETLDFVVGNNGNFYYGNTPITVSINDVTPVPEPESYAMLLAGLGLLSFVARRRKQNAIA